MTTLQFGYLIGMGPVVLTAVVGLPLIWRRPGIFGPLFLWLLIAAFAISATVMTLS